MKIAIENFGAIKKRIVIEPKPLTIFCGANNTGKTYALYVLNALMDSRFIASFDWSKHNARELFESGVLQFPLSVWSAAQGIKNAEKNISHGLKMILQRFFVADGLLTDEAKFEVMLDPTEFFPSTSLGGKAPEITIPAPSQNSLNSLSCTVNPKTSQVKVSLMGKWATSQAVEQALNRLLMRLYFPQREGRDFLLPAERSGINLFFRELNSRRAALLRHVTSQTLDTNELLKDIIVSRYPQPIHDYIEFMNSQPEIKREISDFSDMAGWLQKEVLRVKYKIDRYGDISISPMRSGQEVGLHLGSSTVKTFFGLWSYLNHLARKGDWLMIDEPELNLHPRNQRAISRLLAQLVNRGIYVIVSTHSDYMVREWGNLVMLSEPFEGRDQLAKQFGLPSEQWLAADRVAAYEFYAGGVTAMAVDASGGIQTHLFDENIQELNEASQTIFFAKELTVPASPDSKNSSTKPKRRRTVLKDGEHV